MARVDYTGVAETAPQVEAPNDEQRISASPEAFGSQVGEAVSQGGQQLLDLSKFYGRVAADNATNNTLEQVTNLLHGDPSKQVMGPDGQMVADTGFYGLRGADAMNAWPKVSQQIDQIMRQNGSGLKTPEAQYQYDVDTRRYRAQWLREAGSYADQQQRVWAADTNNTSATLALNAIGRDPMNDDGVAQARETVRGAYVKNAHLAGEDADGAVLKADQAVTLAQLRSLIGQNNGTAAKAVFDKDGGVLASLPNFDQIARQVKSAEIDQEFTPAVDSAVADATAQAQKAVTGGLGVSAPGVSTANNIGNVKAPGGNGFLNPATPTDGVIVAANNLRAGYRGLTLAQIGQKWAPRGDGNNDPVAWAKTVSQHSGIGVNQVPNLNDPSTLRSLIGGIGFAEKSQKEQGAFTPDVISQGVTAALSGRRPNLSVPATPGQAQGTTAPLYTSAADALAGQKPQILQSAQTFAEQKWPDYPDVQERYVSTIERRLDRSITQQDQQYRINSHIVQAAMFSDHPPTSEAELEAISPQVKAAWQAMQLENPISAGAVERMFDANAKGKQTLYGSNFKDYLDRVSAPQDDPDRISNAAQLWPFVGTGADSPLTNSGANALNELMANRGTPQGEAYIGQVRQFMDLAHANLTFTNKAMGIYDEKGEQAFAKFAAQALPVLNNAYKQGQLAQALNPKSPDYVGNMAQAFMRKPDQVMKDRLSAIQGLAGQTLPPFTRQTLDSALNRLDTEEQRKAALKDAVNRKRISLQDATAIGIQRGYIKPPGAAASATLEAPLPQRQAGIPGYSDR